VTISNIKIEGSDAAGESVQVTLMATIINPSNVCLTNVDLAVRSKVFYASYNIFIFIDIRGFQFGHAEIQVRPLLPFFSDFLMMWVYVGARSSTWIQ
jgi:hypothetical protein